MFSLWAIGIRFFAPNLANFYLLLLYLAYGEIDIRFLAPNLAIFVYNTYKNPSKLFKEDFWDNTGREEEIWTEDR